LAAAVDLCRAATLAIAEEHEDIPLKLLAIDIAHEFKVRYFLCKAWIY